MKIIVRSEKETAQVAGELAPTLKAGDVLYMHGDLGAGKSVFARALIRVLCADEGLDVPSPTFTLVQMYDGMDCPVYHYDLYSIQDAEEIFELGWEDAFSEGIVIVEWPSRLGAYKGGAALDIYLSPVENDQDAREIVIERHET